MLTPDLGGVPLRASVFYPTPLRPLRRGGGLFSLAIWRWAMWTRLLPPGLILVAVGIVALLALNFSLEAAQVPIGPGTTVIAPPRPMAAIEFVGESGVERWEVKL